MRPRSPGFSLVEVVVAIGILTFAIIGLVSMLPLGLNLAQNSTEESQAANLISAIASDLKSTPQTETASTYFKIGPLPWQTIGTGGIAPSSTIQVGKDYTYFFADGQTSVPTSADKALYRLTLRYTRVPGQPDPMSADPVPAGTTIEALVVVSWPAAVSALPAAGKASSQGQVDAYLTFPVP